MTNVTYKIEGSKLLVEVNLEEEHGKSKSGKTLVVATTHGFISIPTDNDERLMFSLNVNKG